MVSPDVPDPSEKDIARLVSGLHDLRDALVNMSLLLQDIKFDIDVAQRREATNLTQDSLEKAKKLAE